MTWIMSGRYALCAMLYIQCSDSGWLVAYAPVFALETLGIGKDMCAFTEVV